MPEPGNNLKLIRRLLNSAAVQSTFLWLRTGNEAFAEMLKAIEAAKSSIRLEMYIVTASPVAIKFRDALSEACQRGVRVHLLVDALGSITLSESFWDNFRKSGGHFRWFNRLSHGNWGVRNHRKSLVCDEKVAFVGGFNIAPEYEGDGMAAGWRDLGIKLTGPIACHLAEAFDQMFALAESKQSALARLFKPRQQKTVKVPSAELLLSAPGRVHNPLKRALRLDLERARSVQIICAYFLPTWRIRRELHRIARQGGRVRLILPCKCDVALSRLAARSFYRGMMQAGIEIYEYQPQVLHAKMFIIDDVAYTGSCNLDARSLYLNYELLVRLAEPKVVEEARTIFSADLQHCEKMDLARWKKTRTFWDQLKGRWAHFILARLDPYFSRKQWRFLR